jgi:hypothetical protein
LSISFSKASLNKGYSAVSIGKTQAYIKGLTCLNPSIERASSGLSFTH